MGVFTGGEVGDGLLLVADTMGRFSVGLSKSDSDGDAVDVDDVDALRTVVHDLFVVVGASVVVVVDDVVVDADVVLELVAAVAVVLSSSLAMTAGSSST
jgi:hypothetical protein